MSERDKYYQISIFVSEEDIENEEVPDVVTNVENEGWYPHSDHDTLGSAMAEVRVLNEEDDLGLDKIQLAEVTPLNVRSLFHRRSQRPETD